MLANCVNVVSFNSLDLTVAYQKPMVTNAFLSCLKPTLCLSVSYCLPPGVMFSRSWRFGWDSFSDVDLFSDRYEANAETLIQAIRAATSEEPDADGSVLFGQLQGTVVGLRYYTGVVRINRRLLHSLKWDHADVMDRIQSIGHCSACGSRGRSAKSGGNFTGVTLF